MLSNFLDVVTPNCVQQISRRFRVVSHQRNEILLRRSLITAAAIALLPCCRWQALAVGPPNEPSTEEKGKKKSIKKYANICVSQPTASVCNG